MENHPQNKLLFQDFELPSRYVVRSRGPLYAKVAKLLDKNLKDSTQSMLQLLALLFALFTFACGFCQQSLGNAEVSGYTTR